MTNTTRSVHAVTVAAIRPEGVTLDLSNGDHAHLSNTELAKLRVVKHAFAVTVEEGGAYLSVDHGPRLVLSMEILDRLLLAKRAWDGRQAVSA